MDLKLWVEILPVHGNRPAEFKKTQDGTSVRQWFFMDRRELNEVMYTVFECNGKSLKVVQIGTGPGNMPESKCWWLRQNNMRLAEIEKVQSFAKKLNPLAYPDEDETLAVMHILNNWTLPGKIRLKLIWYYANYENEKCLFY